jgi:glycosyltransferase involved in cell wall biosynthesis
MFLSVIVCTYNRDQHIKRALDSLIAQDFDKSDYEIIVVDNNSNDRTPQIIKDFKASHPDYHITLAHETRQGLSFARNTGLKLAQGSYISYIDDDGIARNDYISQIKKYTEQFPDDVAFGGKVLPKYEKGHAPEWMSKYIERIISIVNLGNEVKVLKKTYPVGCNMIFKKSVFDQIGGFNTALKLRSDDKYIFFKIREAGFRVLYLPKVVVWHFIDHFRNSLDYVKKVSRLNGEAERIRIKTLSKHRGITYIKRLADYLFKLSAALMLWMIYAIKGQSIKGKALFLSMWYSLCGFLNICKK